MKERRGWDVQTRSGGGWTSGLVSRCRQLDAVRNQSLSSDANRRLIVTSEHVSPELIHSFMELFLTSRPSEYNAHAPKNIPKV